MSNHFRKVVTCYQPMIDSITDDLLSKAGYPRNGIKAFVVKQRRGQANYKNVFSVPLWAYFRSREYFTYYIAHELAHMISHRHDYLPGHKEPFYKYFKMICPKEYWHYETGYIKSSGQYFKELKDVAPKKAEPVPQKRIDTIPPKAHRTKELIDFIISD